MSIPFDRFCLIVPVIIPRAVVLSILIGVVGWGCPILLK
jgi:hypothetical protein